MIYFFVLLSINVHRLACELDHSQSHKRFSEDAHVVNNFNLNPGGAITIVRYMSVTKDWLGPFHHNNKLKVGDTCHHVFNCNDCPPKGN